jgi:rifampin ADP-ribosylating transferase
VYAGAYVPVTFEHCAHVRGPFFHGEVAAAVTNSLWCANSTTAGLNHVYFTALVDGRLGSGAGHRAAGSGNGHLCRRADCRSRRPDVTNKKFPGNVTRSFRSRDPLRVVGEVDDWQGHAPEVLAGMLENLARLREQGLDIIED